MCPHRLLWKAGTTTTTGQHTTQEAARESTYIDKTCSNVHSGQHDLHEEEEEGEASRKEGDGEGERKLTLHLTRPRTACRQFWMRWKKSERSRNRSWPRLLRRRTSQLSSTTCATTEASLSAGPTPQTREYFCLNCIYNHIYI